MNEKHDVLWKDAMKEVLLLVTWESVLERCHILSFIEWYCQYMALWQMANPYKTTSLLEMATCFGFVQDKEYVSKILYRSGEQSYRCSACDKISSGKGNWTLRDTWWRKAVGIGPSDNFPGLAHWIIVGQRGFTTTASEIVKCICRRDHNIFEQVI